MSELETTITGEPVLEFESEKDGAFRMVAPEIDHRVKDFPEGEYVVLKVSE